MPQTETGGYTYAIGMPNYDHDLSKVDRILDLLNEPGACGIAGFMFKPARKFRGAKHPACIMGKMVYAVAPDRTEAEFNAVASQADYVLSVDDFIGGMRVIEDAKVNAAIHERFGISGFMYSDLWGSNDGPNTPKERRQAVRDLVNDWKQGKHLGEGMLSNVS